VFIQVIQGKCNDADGIHRRMDMWREDLEPGAEGFLGGTYGLTDDNEFIGVVRFDSRDSAMRNSNRPEQGAWWAETAKCFDGEATFHDCDDVTLMLDGGSDDAEFVQVIQGRVSDPAKLHQMMDNQPMEMLHQQRPDIIGGTIAIDKDGFFTQTIAFRSEAEAREYEKKEMPAEMREQMESMNAMESDVSYHDLHHPWFATAGRR
jgi:hypothetical protein